MRFAVPSRALTGRSSASVMLRGSAKNARNSRLGRSTASSGRGIRAQATRQITGRPALVWVHAAPHARPRPARVGGPRAGRLGPLPALKRAVTGYTAGYNDALKAGGDARCLGEPWVHPIDEMTVYRRFYQLALLASSGVAVDGIGGAQPAADPVAALAAQQRAMASLKPDQFDDLPGGLGSNAVALGSPKTPDPPGRLLPHPPFPST